MFKDVIGHQDIKQRLIASLQTGRISHAQLFAGDTGYGSFPLSAKPDLRSVTNTSTNGAVC